MQQNEKLTPYTSEQPPAYLEDGADVALNMAGSNLVSPEEGRRIAENDVLLAARRAQRLEQEALASPQAQIAAAAQGVLTLRHEVDLDPNNMGFQTDYELAR